jgi:4-azaleucine resistance transporter AzlC
MNKPKPIYENEYLYALITSLPIVAGYFTVSFVFGISSINLGLPIWFATTISILVYGGSAQFVFLALFIAGANILTLVVTVFFVNLRYMMMSIYMSSVFDKIGLHGIFRWLYGHGLTDESFAFHSAVKAKDLTAKYFLSFNFLCYLGWVLGSLLGSLLALKFKAFNLIQLEYSLIAMMLYVLVIITNDKLKIIVALVTIIAMICLSLIYESNFNIFLATFIGCGTGLWLKKKL